MANATETGTGLTSVVNNHVPLVSIGMPVFNGDNFVKQAIESILQQSFTDFELIISDNGSTDRTQAICRSFGDRDRRIRYCRGEVNRGSAWNYNHVFQLSRGRYFKWAAHDDVLAPHFIRRSVEILEQFPDVVLCFPRTMIINDQSAEVMYNDRDHFFLMDDNPAQRFKAFFNTRRGPLMCGPIFGVFRKETLEQTRLIGSYDESDFILLGHVAMLGKFYEIPEVLFYYRDHALTSINAAKNGNAQDLAAWFAPENLYSLQVPCLRWPVELLKSILSVKMSLWMRILCILYMHRWIPSKGKEFARDVVWALVWPFRRWQFVQQPRPDCNSS